MIIFIASIIFAVPIFTPRNVALLNSFFRAGKIYRKIDWTYLGATIMPALLLFIFTSDYGGYRFIRLVILAVVNIGLAHLFFVHGRKKVSIIFRYYIIIWSIVFLICHIFWDMGSFFSAEIGGKLVFRVSFHGVWWVGVILFFCKSVIERKIDVIDITLFLSFSVLSSGRSAILLGAFAYFLLMGRILFNRRSSFKEYFLLFIVVCFALFLGNSVISSSKGLNERGFRLVARNSIYMAYMDNLKKEDILFGFHPNFVAGVDLEYLDREDGSSSIVMTESSIISLVSHHGFFSIFYLGFLFYRLRWLDLISGIILLIIFIRAATGDFLFFTVFDFIFLATRTGERRS